MNLKGQFHEKNEWDILTWLAEKNILFFGHLKEKISFCALGNMFNYEKGMKNCPIFVHFRPKSKIFKIFTLFPRQVGNVKKPAQATVPL